MSACDGGWADVRTMTGRAPLPHHSSQRTPPQPRAVPAPTGLKQEHPLLPHTPLSLIPKHRLVGIASASICFSSLKNIWSVSGCATDRSVGHTVPPAFIHASQSLGGKGVLISHSQRPRVTST